jgi:hypothetical protein
MTTWEVSRTLRASVWQLRYLVRVGRLNPPRVENRMRWGPGDVEAARAALAALRPNRRREAARA